MMLILGALCAVPAASLVQNFGMPRISSRAGAFGASSALRAAPDLFPEDVPFSSATRRWVELSTPANLEVSTEVREGVTSLLGEEGQQVGGSQYGGETAPARASKGGAKFGKDRVTVSRRPNPLTKRRKGNKEGRAHVAKPRSKEKAHSLPLREWTI